MAVRTIFSGHRPWGQLARPKRYPLLPDLIDYTDLSASGGNALRPEYANSAFDLYVLTGDQKYRDAAYRYFRAMRSNQRVTHGYTVVDDATTNPVRRGDNTPGYWYLSTEGKILWGAREGGRPSVTR